MRTRRSKTSRRAARPALAAALAALLAIMVWPAGGLLAQYGPEGALGDDFGGGDVPEEAAAAPPQTSGVTEYRLGAAPEGEPGADTQELSAPPPITVRTYPPGTTSGPEPLDAYEETRRTSPGTAPLPLPPTGGATPLAPGGAPSPPPVSGSLDRPPEPPETVSAAPGGAPPALARQPLNTPARGAEPPGPNAPEKAAQGPPPPAPDTAKGAPKNQPEPSGGARGPASGSAPGGPAPGGDKAEAGPGVAKAEAAPVGSAQSAGDIQIPYNPGLEVTADNVEEVLSRPLEGEAAGSGGLLVWRGSRLYRKNPDGTLSLMDSSLDVQTDDLGQKWLDYDEAGNAIIQVSLKVWATINFAYDSAEINADSVKVLEAFGRALNTPALRSSSLLIAGHTDSNGAPPYNIRLSRERANAVSKWLHDNMGVDQDRLICTGYGQDHPIAPNDTPEGQAKNRRVEFVLLPEMNTES